jgi:adenylate kinase
LNIPTISSGEILRRNIRKGTILGREASEAMNSGVLVHDELICKMLDCRTKEPDCVRGYILDGIPRTLNQAEFLELQLARVLARPFLPIVLSLEVDDETLLKRLCGRRICPICSSSYNIETKPPIIASICDFDGAILEMREDDREEVCLRRLGTYHTIASKMKDFYRSRYTVREINGNRPIHEIDLDLFTLILNSCRAAI